MISAYLITWRTYETFLHGDDGAVDRNHAGFGSATRESRPGLSAYERSLMTQPPVVLDPEQREVVHRSIEQTCELRGWALLACNVRTNHVHVVVACECPPEQAMNSLKSWATTAMRKAWLIERSVRPWARHGSTRYLYEEPDVERAVYYVLEMQDEPRVKNE